MFQILQYFSELSERIIASPEFQSFGIGILFLWCAIPTSIPVTEIITLPLYLIGISPILLVIVTTLGVTVGNYILYVFGIGTHRVIKGMHRKEADASSLLHRYRLPIFIAVPFLFVAGDIIMSIAGYQRIGFRKILPYLLFGELIRSSLGILMIMGLVKLPSFLNF